MILNISYDVNKPKTNGEYDDLYDTIKSAPGWCHAMDSFWFISTGESVEEWSKRLMQCIDKNDYLFVVDTSGQSRQGWMRKDVWQWLQQHDN